MKPIKLEDIAHAVDGRLNNPNIAHKTVCGVHFDTREDISGKLFVALKGVRDGHDFIENAINGGAVCALSEVETDFDAIIVSDAMKALGQLASYYLSLFDVKVIGLTGSSGKTSCKDMIASVLSEKYSVIKTQGNYNNEIGMPLTIFNITDETEIAVLEMGMNNRWEIHRLSKIANPYVAVITNIGMAHIENLGSQEEIFNAKSEILDFLVEDGKVILYGDDEFLKRHKNRADAVFYGRGEQNDYIATNEKNNKLTGSSYSVVLKNGEKIDLIVPVAGRHMVTNSLAAAAVGECFGLNSKEIASGLEKFKPTGHRMDIFETKCGITIIADCYNANPDSMRAALNVLAMADGDKIAILGDMFELGDISQHEHYKIGCLAAKIGLETLVCIGKDAKHIYEGAYSKHSEDESKSQIMYFDTKACFFEHMPQIIKKGDCVLVKASAGMKFDEIVRELSES